MTDPHPWNQQWPDQGPNVVSIPEPAPTPVGRTLNKAVLVLAAVVVCLVVTLIVVMMNSNETSNRLQALKSSISAASSSSSAAASASQVLNAPFMLTGTLTMPLSNTDALSSCSGTRGYDDIKEGTSVVVYDETNTVVATGYLLAGIPGSSCVFNFSVPNVPGSKKFYQVEISHRGKVTVSSAEAKAGEYAVTLGS